MTIPLSSWLFLISCLTVFFGSNVVLVCGQCQSDQLSLLLQLKNNLIFNSSLSTKLVKWNQGTDSWDGVTCEEGRVTGLDLSNESISGGVENSSALFSLQYLQSLNLAFNRFNGTQISSRFGKLANLSYLNLSNAGFAGQIPIGISHLASLVTLDLSTLDSSILFYLGFRLKLEDPNLLMLVQNLKILEELHLDGVNISAQGNEWGQALSSSLPNLRVLSLSLCELSGPIDPSLVQLKYLSEVRLDDNNLSAPVPDFFANFSNLTSLSLSSCEFHGIFPEQIFHVSTLLTLDLKYNTMLQGSLPQFSQNGSLQTLVLSNTNFSGTLPGSIGKLKMLTRLELSGCNFSGPIPNLMTNLTRLVILDLSSNSFNRRIPMSLFKMPSLQKIQLSHNQFTGFLNVSSHVSSSLLETLDLSSNMLQGQFPTFVFGLQGLKVLALSSNNFSGTVQLDKIRQLRNLSVLDLSYNSLSINANGDDSTLSSFPQIFSLQLASCKLRTFPDFLKNQSRLRVLDLSDNQINGEIPKWIWKIELYSLNLSHNFLVNEEGPLQNFGSTLNVLDLHSNKFQGPIPLALGCYYLDYSNNNFSSAIPADIGNYVFNAGFFSLSSNNFHGTIPQSICEVFDLQVLDLSRNNLSGVIPQCLTSETTLEVLNLGKNNLNGNISDTFGNCALQTLDVNGNLLEGKLPKSLANCTKLEVLDLGNNYISDTFPCYLKNISSLRVLVLRSNKFSGSINCSRDNVNWPRLHIVDLASNNFSGKLPKKWLGTMKAMMDDEGRAQAKLKYLGDMGYTFDAWFGIYIYLPYNDITVTVTNKRQQMELGNKIITVFTSIDLSCNNFQGSIPEVIGELKELQALNLSNNALVGQLPSSLGNLQQLESLDLSWNQLNGVIPTQLASLHFLSVLDLSFNQLIGRIPTGTQLQSFPEASFQENAGLCGRPLADNCTETGERPGSPPRTSEDSGNEIEWELVCAEIGFAVGFGIVVMPLLFWKRWRQWYYKHVDQLLFRIFPKLDQGSRNRGRRVRTRIWRQRQ